MALKIADTSLSERAKANFADAKIEFVDELNDYSKHELMHKINLTPRDAEAAIEISRRHRGKSWHT